MPLSSAALEPLLRLALVPGIGPQRLALLIHRFGSAERALAAPAAELAQLPGIGPGLRQRLGRDVAPRARAALAALHRAGAVALTPDDLSFPDAFRTLPDPPYLLFAVGDLALLQKPGVAVVGTRAPSAYGRAAAAQLGGDLARAGLAVVSGMARGIDAVAHAAALDAGGATVGVLGHGVDRIYPPENHALFQRMRQEGLLLTEFPPGERPAAGNFPRRNRLIAALSRGVVVVEMGLKSGAQHTVTYALEQGREVFAVPGPIGAETSAGTNQLIKEGARVVTGVEDVLEELQGVGARPAPPAAARVDAPPAARDADLPLFDAAEDRVLAVLSREPLHVDELAAAAALESGPLLAALCCLELRGVAQALPGKRFRRA